jgi:IPT/TIG domain
MTTPVAARPRGDPRAIALGPGYIYTAKEDTPEPTDLDTPWEQVDPGWFLIGYTETGSEFNYALTSGEVQVAEELDPVLISSTARAASLAFAMAEMTASNLAFAMNGGVIIITDKDGNPDPAGEIVVVEPPDLGVEVRVMLGWESEDHSERWVMRKCFQTGTMKIARAKGTANATIATTFTLEKPGADAAGVPRRLFKAIFDRAFRGGWSPQIPPIFAVPVITSITPATHQSGATTAPVQIAGTGFDVTSGATTVTVDGAPATVNSVPSAVLINATLPANATPGPVDVTVTTPGGTSAPHVFTYTP